MTLARRRITTAAEMKALAHPVRLDLMTLLVEQGPMTATDAAGTLSQTPANVSWHLRKLAELGFVRQATAGPGRRRPWKAVTESLSWGDDADNPALGHALRDVLVEREVQVLRAATARHDTEPTPWQEATSVNQSRLWLTPEEAQQLGEGLRDLLATHAERLHDPDARPDNARLMALMGWIVPAAPDPGVGP